VFPFWLSETLAEWNMYYANREIKGCIHTCPRSHLSKIAFC
jgi:hypothetical protein